MSRALAVFCDFDGTFSVQDVGSTLAQRYMGERRAALWTRFERGELAAWDYTKALLDGFALPPEDLDSFLRTIELDAGARALVTWCEKRGVPFRVLSDGFDYNLDRLQEIHGIEFAYIANHLQYEHLQHEHLQQEHNIGSGSSSGAADAAPSEAETLVWRISPGGPDPQCGCGTGTCKRRHIAQHRAAHPGAYCVHIGNGRVSDLCGALEADLAFAKDTLAEALDAQHIGYNAFGDLHEVVAALDQLPDQPGSR